MAIPASAMVQERGPQAENLGEPADEHGTEQEPAVAEGGDHGDGGSRPSGARSPATEKAMGATAESARPTIRKPADDQRGLARSEREAPSRPR